ncbi:tRNA (guanosine(37)-N1)-methyltransferase TrmD [Candidatus Microgenomates bacterium]|nr:tRNA (guanosine(37)-N1)-methyltransferase TrmD [Candidatus Microgenomates bacterium]
MKITILTLFPEMFTGVLNTSILKRAQTKGLVTFEVRYLRDWTLDAHKTVDDRPYGGGAGMVLKADVVYRALKDISDFRFQISDRKKSKKNKSTIYNLQSTIILPTPKGKIFNQQLALKYSKKQHLVFICPHYEGYDERIVSMVDEKVSMGQYIVTGGEIPVMMMIDAIVRLVKGVIREESLREESFNNISDFRFQISDRKKSKKTKSAICNLQSAMEYPQYTRPEALEIVLKGKKIKKRVPKVLLSGNHALIAKWRKGKGLVSAD